MSAKGASAGYSNGSMSCTAGQINNMCGCYNVYIDMLRPTFRCKAHNLCYDVQLVRES